MVWLCCTYQRKIRQINIFIIYFFQFQPFWFLFMLKTLQRRRAIMILIYKLRSSLKYVIAHVLFPFQSL